MCCMLRARDARIAELEAELAACQSGGATLSGVLVDSDDDPSEDTDGDYTHADP